MVQVTFTPSIVCHDCGAVKSNFDNPVVPETPIDSEFIALVEDWVKEAVRLGWEECPDGHTVCPKCAADHAKNLDDRCYDSVGMGVVSEENWYVASYREGDILWVYYSTDKDALPTDIHDFYGARIQGPRQEGKDAELFLAAYKQVFKGHDELTRCVIQDMTDGKVTSMYNLPDDHPAYREV